MVKPALRTFPLGFLISKAVAATFRSPQIIIGFCLYDGCASFIAFHKICCSDFHIVHSFRFTCICCMHHNKKEQTNVDFCLFGHFSCLIGCSSSVFLHTYGNQSTKNHHSGYPGVSFLHATILFVLVNILPKQPPSPPHNKSPKSNSSNRRR